MSADRAHQLLRLSPEAIRKAAARNALPVDQITQVQVLDPYFYAGEVM